MSNSLSRGFYSGIIGGMAAGLWIFIYVFLRGEWSTLPDFSSIDFWLDYFIFQFGLHAIFGGIFGLVYSRFYDGIPGKTVKKGLVFGILVGLLANIFWASGDFLRWIPSGIEEYHLWGVGWVEGFLKWIPYGVVIGIVYERLKL